MPPLAWHNYHNFKDYEDIKPYNLSGVGFPDFKFPDELTRTLRRAYYAALTHADHEFGRVLAELQSLGLSDNTIISFWGDHGWQLGEHSEWEKHTNFEVTKT